MQRLLRLFAAVIVAACLGAAQSTVSAGEGIIMPSTFVPAYYLRRNPDVAQAGFTEHNVINHYLANGIDEGRSPNPFFDPKFYLEAWGDLSVAFGPTSYRKALEHWLRHGIDEGRRGNAFFNVTFYLTSHSDLQAAFGATGYRKAYEHYVRNGIAERRRPTLELSGANLEGNEFVFPEEHRAVQVAAAAGPLLREMLKHGGKVIELVRDVNTVLELCDRVGLCERSDSPKCDSPKCETSRGEKCDKRETSRGDKCEKCEAGRGEKCEAGRDRSGSRK
jgi:hypothetical protein